MSEKGIYDRKDRAVLVRYSDIEKAAIKKAIGVLDDALEYASWYYDFIDGNYSDYTRFDWSGQFDCGPVFVCHTLCRASHMLEIRDGYRRVKMPRRHDYTGEAFELPQPFRDAFEYGRRLRANKRHFDTTHFAEALDVVDQALRHHKQAWRRTEVSWSHLDEDHPLVFLRSLFEVN